MRGCSLPVTKSPFRARAQIGALSPYFRRSTSQEIGNRQEYSLILVYMAVNRAVVQTYFDGGYPNWFAITYFLDGSTGAVDASYGITFSIAGVNSWNDIVAAAEIAVNNYATAQGYTLSAGIIWPPGMGRTFTYPTLAVNTARQVTSDTLVVASVEIDATLSLTTGAKGTVTLEYADDSAFTTNVKIAGIGVNGNTGTLVIGLNTVGAGGGAVAGVIPASKYYRLLTTNVTGTPTYGTPSIQEVTL